MFEERKDKAKKTMGKKDKRVQEITSLLAEEITPKLNTLRSEKRSFIQWQKSCSELEKIARLLRAFEWVDAKDRVDEKEKEMVTKKNEIDGFKKAKVKLGKEIESAEKDAKEVTRQKEKEMKKGGKFKKLEEEVGELGKAVVKVRTNVEIKQSTISDEEGRVKDLEKELEEVSQPHNPTYLS